MRRGPSSTTSLSAQEASPQPTLPRRQPYIEEPEEEETHGEWAEALYKYSSSVSVIKLFSDLTPLNSCLQEAGDLALEEHQRVLVTERTSDDWYVFLITNNNGRTHVCFCPAGGRERLMARLVYSLLHTSRYCSHLDSAR